MSDHPRAIAGGRKRGEQLHARRRGRAVPHQRDRQSAMALIYPVRHLAHEPFLELYYAYCYRIGKVGNAQGAETAWAQYQRRMRAFHAMGQGFSSTNRRSAIAMDKARRPRCERTTRRVDRKLEAMGLLRRIHVKRGQWREGARDHLAITMLCPPATLLGGKFSQNVHRSVGEQQQPSGRAAASRDRAVCDGKDDRASAAYGGRVRKPAATPPANSSDEESWARAQLVLPISQQHPDALRVIARRASERGGNPWGPAP